MKMLNIKIYPDASLKKKAKSVSNIDGNIQRLIANMAYTMYKSKGIGLAAPQIGISSKIIVYDLDGSGNSKFSAMINPKIVRKNEKMISENEGCLSLPYFRMDIERFKEILVEGMDQNGKALQVKAKGILSIVLQHEIDHLDGILLTDKINYFKKQIYRKLLFKHQKSRK